MDLIISSVGKKSDTLVGIGRATIVIGGGQTRTQTFTVAAGVRCALGLSLAYLSTEFFFEFVLIRCVAKIFLCLAFVPMYVKKDVKAGRELAFLAWTLGLPAINIIHSIWFQVLANPNFPAPNTHAWDSYKAAGWMVDEHFPTDPKKQAKICNFDENSEAYETPEQCQVRMQMRANFLFLFVL